MSYTSDSTPVPLRTPTPSCSSSEHSEFAHATSDYGSIEGTHVQQCVRCLHYGHDRCRRRPRCFRCGSFEHTDWAACRRPVTCLNCGGPHHSRARSCPSRLRELTIQQLVHKQGVPRKQAVLMAASFGFVGGDRQLPPAAGSAAAAGSDARTKQRSIAVQTDPPPADAATQTEFAAAAPPPPPLAAISVATATAVPTCNNNNNYTCCKCATFQPPPLPTAAPFGSWGGYPMPPYYPVQVQLPYAASSQLHWTTAASAAASPLIDTMAAAAATGCTTSEYFTPSY